MCIKNWLRRLFRYEKKYIPSKAEIAIDKLWAKKKIDAMFNAEYLTLVHPFDAKDFGDRIYINRISQLTEDLDKEQK